MPLFAALHTLGAEASRSSSSAFLKGAIPEFYSTSPCLRLCHAEVAQGSTGLTRTSVNASSGTGPQPGVATSRGEMAEGLENLLQEMNAKFATLSSSIFGKLDDVAAKLDSLEQQLESVIAQEQEANANDEDFLLNDVY